MRQAERDWYRIQNAAGSGEADVWIYDRIGVDFWSEGVRAKDFVRELAAIDAERISLHLNSPGGSVFDGTAIYNALLSHPATITTYIEGAALSIASVIALAGERVVMAQNAYYMIHNPLGSCDGDAAAMRKYAELLELVAETIIGTYAAKTGKDTEALASAMAAETWFTADAALEWGFVDEISDPIAVAAAFDLEGFGYRHAPDPLSAGLVLSARHKTDLESAADLLRGVIDSAGSTDSDSSAEGDAEPLTAEGAEPEPETVRVFVAGRFRNFSPKGHTR